MTIEEYKNLYKEDDPVGWIFIDKQLEEVYGVQKPRHYAPTISHILGGPDPLDGISIYDNEKQVFHRHLISYGMSELYYNEDSAGKEFSNWGFEFTFRIVPFEDDKGDPLWATQVMNNLARYVLKSGKWFEEFHFVPANGPIRLNAETEIFGFAFCVDPELGQIATPNGDVTFLQMVGLTKKELERLKQTPKTTEVEKVIDEMRKENPLLITDLKRKN